MSVSPLIRRGLPYLETETGRNTPLRKYLPDSLYYSKQMKQDSPPRKPKFAATAADDAVAALDHNAMTMAKMMMMTSDQALNEANGAPSTGADIHPFLRAKITPAMSKDELLSLLADFRAKGVRPKANDRRTTKKVSSAAAAYVEQQQQHHADDSEMHKVDCLDPFQLQQLCVLFSSYCPTSANAPNFCVPPW